MSEAATRLATALARLRVAALRALARRSGLALAPPTAHALIIRRGLSSAAELLRLSARAPRPLRPGFLWILVRLALRARAAAPSSPLRPTEG